MANILTEFITNLFENNIYSGLDFIELCENDIYPGSDIIEPVENGKNMNQYYNGNCL